VNLKFKLLLPYYGRAFGLKREEVAGHWRRLHNEELHNLNASPDVIRIIKSGTMRWAGTWNTCGRDEKRM